MNSFFGLKIHSSPYVPKKPRVQLSHDFHAVSPAFKSSFNEWLRVTFGEDEQVLFFGDQILMRPETLAVLRVKAAQ